MASGGSPIPLSPGGRDAPDSAPLCSSTTIASVENAGKLGNVNAAPQSGAQPVPGQNLNNHLNLSETASNLGDGDGNANIRDDNTVSSSEPPIFSVGNSSNLGGTIATEDTDNKVDGRVDPDGANAGLTDSDAQSKASLLGVAGPETQQSFHEDETAAGMTNDSSDNQSFFNPAQSPAEFMEGDPSPDRTQPPDDRSKRDPQVPILGSSNFTEEPSTTTTAPEQAENHQCGAAALSPDPDSSKTTKAWVVALFKSGRLHPGPIGASNQTSSTCPTQHRSDSQDDRKIRVGVGSPMELRRWSKRHPLRYFFNGASFPGNDARFVKDVLKQAIQVWARSGFGLRVEETRFEDSATFSVMYRESSANDETLADAFFPGDELHPWSIRVFKKALRGRHRQNLLGVLCHELGHVWGLRHESGDRTPSGLFGEENSASVMNKYCPDNTDDLEVHQTDLDGLRAVYTLGEPYLEVLMDGEIRLVKVVDIDPVVRQPGPSDRNRGRWGTWGPSSRPTW